MLQHVGAELSAHDTITAVHERWGSIAQLTAEYETIAQAAEHDRWADLIHASGLTPEQAESALIAELRRAEANHHDMATLLSQLVRARKMPRLIVGLIPSADGTMGEDLCQALDERREFIETRADAVLDSAFDNAEPWASQLGPIPDDPRRRQARRHHARTVAAYRDRYQIAGPSPLGAELQSEAQKIDDARAKAALSQAQLPTQPDTSREREPATRTDSRRHGPTL